MERSQILREGPKSKVNQECARVRGERVHKGVVAASLGAVAICKLQEASEGDLCEHWSHSCEFHEPLASIMSHCCEDCGRPCEFLRCCCKRHEPLL